MLLGYISLLDCLVFLFFLAPQLLLHVNTLELLSCIFYALPFIRKYISREICKCPGSSTCSDITLGSDTNTLSIHLRKISHEEK